MAKKMAGTNVSQNWATDVTGASTASDVSEDLQRSKGNPLSAAVSSTGSIAKGSEDMLTLGTNKVVNRAAGAVLDAAGYKGPRPAGLGTNQTLGQTVQEGLQSAGSKIDTGISNLDPTRVGRADTTGVDAASGRIQTAAEKAAALAASLQRQGVQAERVMAPGELSAGQVELPPEVMAERVRGSLQGVQAGTAEAASFDAARIQAIREAQAARIAREDADIRSRQLALAQALEAQAAGTAPSLAEAQLRRSGEQAIASQMALAASARGGNPVLAQRQAAQQTAAIQQDLAGRAAELRIQEQNAARQALGQVLGETRGQDIGVTTEQARLAQQAELSNVEADRARALAQAQLEQQAAQFGAAEQGTTSRFNVEQALRGDLANQEADLRAALADQAAVQQAAQFNVQASQGAQQFNAKAADEMARFSADAGLRAQIANQAATLQAQGMTLDGIAKFLGIEQASLNAVLGAETAKLGLEADRQKQIAAARAAAFSTGVTTAGNVLSSAGQSVGAIAAMCFPAGELVTMANGDRLPIELITEGEEVHVGGRVLGVRKYASSEALYKYYGATATAEHAVWCHDRWQWAPIRECGELISEVGIPRDVYSLVTTNGVFMVGNVLCGDDEHDADDLNAEIRKVG